MEHRGFALALDALGQGAALCIRLAKPDVATPHGASFTNAPVRIPFIRYKQKHRQMAVLLFVVEHRGFALALDALGQGAALKPRRGFIH